MGLLGGNRRLGKRSRLYEMLLAPLSTRERVVFVSLIIGSMVFFTITGAGAGTSGIGSTMAVPASSCQAGQDWIRPDFATGHPEGDGYQAVLAPNDGAGTLICGGFAATEQPRTNERLVLSAQLRDQLPTTPGDIIHTPQTVPRLLDEQLPKTEPANRYTATNDKLDEFLLISLSLDRGHSWQPLHMLTSDKLADYQHHAIELPRLPLKSYDRLAFKLETVGVNVSQYLAVDSLRLGYDVAASQDLKLELFDQAGQPLEGDNPALIPNQTITAVVSTLSPGTGPIQGVTRALTGLGGGDQTAPPASFDIQLISGDGKRYNVPAETSWLGATLGNHQQWQLTLAVPDELQVGSHTLSLQASTNDGTQSISQDFSWGVLALNTDSSVYRTNQTGKIDMTVLNDKGRTVCDADVELSVAREGHTLASYSTRENSITVGNLCSQYGPHIDPDYTTKHNFDQPGRYTLTLKATTQSGTYQITDQVVTEDEPAALVSRHGPTRLYPVVPYDMVVSFTPDQDFKGVITEYAPASFKITSTPLSPNLTYNRIAKASESWRIEWDVTVAAGQTVNLSYRFDAPDDSPEFYLLGPLRASQADDELFREVRSWQLAADSVGGIGIWRDSAGSQTPGTSFASMNFATEQRNDGIYTFSGGNTLQFDEDGNYLLIATVKATDTSNARVNREGRFGYSGSGSFVTLYGSSYSRDAANNTDWLRVVGLVWGAQASDTAQFEWRRDTDAGATGSIADASHFQVVRLHDSAAVGLYTDANDTGAYSNQTWTDAPFDNTVLETDTSIIEKQAGSTDVRLKQDATTFLVGYGLAFNQASNARTQRVSKMVAGSTDIPQSFGYAYLRQISDEYGSPNNLFLYRNSGSSTDLSVQAQLGNAEGAGTVSRRANSSGMFVIELPSSAGVLIADDGTGGQDIGGTNGDFNAIRTVSYNDSASFTKIDDATINAEATMDALLLGSAYAERTTLTSTVRATVGSRLEINGSDQALGEHGNYLRGDQGTTGTFNYSSHPTGVFGLSSGDDLQFEWFDAGDNGNTDNTVAGAVGFSALDLTSLAAATSSVTTQLHHRWRDDTTALNTSGGWLAAEDANSIGDITKNATYRLRFDVANVGSFAQSSAKTYELQWGELSGGSDCSTISTWTGLADTSDEFAMVDSSQISPDGQSTSSIMANSEGYTFVAGEGRDSADTTGSIGPMLSNRFTELEYSIQATDDAVTGASYCFRLYDAAASLPLELYVTYPQATLASVDLDVDVNLGEAGTFAAPADGGWATINFSSSYSSPVVVGVTNTATGNNARVFEAKNVTSTSADMRICESDGHIAAGCATHPSETAGYVIIDADDADLIDGIEAGTFGIDGGIDTNTLLVNFDETYSTAPLVFASVQTASTDGSTAPVVARVTAASTANFTAGICEQNSQDGCNASHGTETVGWVAIDPGNLPFDELADAGSVTGTSAGAWVGTGAFTPSFSAAPVVLAKINDNIGGQDVMISEADSVTATSANVRFCELDGPDTCDSHSSNQVAWLAVETGGLTGTRQVALDQTAYRFYQNLDAVQPTTALAAENTAATGVGLADVIRLRLSAQAGLDDILAGDLSFKLQFGAGANCSAIGSWTDVGGLSSSTIWRGYNNSTPADGATLSASLLNSQTNALESYEETNDSAFNPNDIDAATRGEWDWVIFNNGAAETSQYCFRLATAAGDVLTYSRYPQLTTATAPTPDAPTFYDDDGGVSQVAFNNIRQNSTTPTYRLSAASGGYFNRFQLELNTAANFGGTSYVQTFSGLYAPATAYNLLADSLSPSLPTTNGVTYYVRARASGNGGSGWGNWFSGTWTYTYKSADETPEWFQTTDTQFQTGTLTDTVASSNSVILGPDISATGGTIDDSSVAGYRLHVFTSDGTFEVTSGTGDVEVLVVAGGGGGGSAGGTGGGGGGGAGGLIFDTVAVSGGQYTVTVGGGGSAGSGSAGGNGGNSLFDSLTALGGGGGAFGSGEPSNGVDGGSGGGARGFVVAVGGTGLQPGSGSGGFGNDGGDTPSGGTGGPGGGGGGAGSVGGDGIGTTFVAGDGGDGRDYSTQFGTGVGASGLFAGGGGGGHGNNAGSSGGSATAGGGAGGLTNAVGSTGQANTGGGGGGGGSNNSNGGAGGSGIIIVRYPLYALTGTITSTEIDFDRVPNMVSWNDIDFSTTETNGDVKLSVYYTASTACDTIIPDSALSGNSSGFDVSGGSIDITGLNTTTYNRICLRASLSFSGGTPLLNDWSVSWYPTSNDPPDSPTSLTQKKVTGGATISTGGWTNETQVQFEAQATDPDNPDSLRLCIEVQPLGTNFTNVETSCGSPVAYSGSAVTVSHTVTGLTDNQQYHWQARVSDVISENSAWVSYGGNPEAEQDFGIDTSPPTGTVYDGSTAGVDIDLNSGSLSELDANWNIDSAVSGLGSYDYSVGTSPGAIDILGWTSNGTSTSATASTLSLNTSQPYYFNVRTTDNAGNQAVISSDGILVAPTLSFSASPGSIAFANLNAGNSYTDTQNAVLATSTNAYRGYEIRTYITTLPTSPELDVISLFNGGTYPSPDEWLAGDNGYGYTSNDTTISGVNLFNSTPCDGGGNPPCFAPFSLSAPGDIVADHTDLVVGAPVSNENFIVTHRVTVSPTQTAATYQTEVIYTATVRY